MADPVHDPSFYLVFGAQRVDDDAAIHGTKHFVYPRGIPLHGQVQDLGNIGIMAEIGRNPPGLAARCPCVPVGFFPYQFQDSGIALGFIIVLFRVAHRVADCPVE